MQESRLNELKPAGSRRGFLKTLAGLSALGLPAWTASAGAWKPLAGTADRSRIRALLISATTLAGKGSLEHARPFLKDLYGDRMRIMLINFASLPEDRDAYEARMQRDFKVINPAFEVASLHRVAPSRAAEAIREAEAFFVSGGNTFLLLRELYDRFVVDLLRERVLAGVPYAGSSAGSNIGGTVIGTTNDFPITDIPTRRCLGLFPGVYNPHHPEESEAEFGSRQWKIAQYTRYNSEETVIGVTDPGMLHLEGERLKLVGEGGMAWVRKGSRQAQVLPGESGNVTRAWEQVANG